MRSLNRSFLYGLRSVGCQLIAKSILTISHDRVERKCFRSRLAPMFLKTTVAATIAPALESDAVSSPPHNYPYVVSITLLSRPLPMPRTAENQPAPSISHYCFCNDPSYSWLLSDRRLRPLPHHLDGLAELRIRP